MLMLLNGHSLERKKLIRPESMSLNLSERDSSAQVTIGPDAPAIAPGDWVQDLDAPGKGIVWRVKSVDTQYDKQTRTVTLEQMIKTLGDTILPKEVKSSDMGGGDTCTARQAVAYILGKQEDWKLGGFQYDVSNPYKFDGETLLAALETVIGTLDDCILEYNYSSYPFRLYVRKLSSTPESEMRAGRNLQTLKYTIDRNRMYTRLYPVGKDNLRLSGSGYVQKNTGKYGVIERTETDASKETEAQLRTWAEARLKKHCEPSVTVTVTGLDLSAGTGEPMDSFIIGHQCRIPVPAEGITITEKVTKLSWRDKIKDPESVTITLANTLEDVQSIIRQEQTTASSGRRTGAKRDGERNIEIGDVENGLYTAISQTATEIRLEANDKINGLHSELTITASQIQSQLKNEKTGYESRITQLADQIRMEVENKVLGLSSSITQTAENIRLQVKDAREQTQSQIDINKRDISLKVSEKDLTASFVIGIINGTTTAQINASRINLKGYVTATQLSSQDISFYKLHSDRGGITCRSVSATKLNVGGVDCSNIYKAFKNVEATETNGDVTLTFTDFTSGNHNTKTVTFNKAARLKGSWSGGVYTASPDPTGASTTVSTAISSTPYNVRYVESFLTVRNTYMVEIGYTEDGVLKSTGRSVSFVATEAYEAGMRAATPSAPTYSGTWSYGTLTVKANDVGVYSKTVNKVDQIADEDVVWSPAYKNLLATLTIRDQQDEDIGYHPLIVMPATKAYEAGWKANHDSNKYSIEMGSDAEYKDVKRPGASSGAAAEMWFRLRMQAEWATRPGSDDITESNTVTWNTQRRLSGGSSWDNVLSVKSTITLSAASNGKTVYAKVGAQNVAKIGITHTPTVSGWSVTGVSYASGGLSKKAASALRITAQVGVDGKNYSKLITTAKEFSLGKLIGDDEYAALKYGSTAVAWLKMPERTIPEPTVTDFQLTGISPYGTIASGRTAKASIGISFKVNDTTITQTLVTGNSFSLEEGAFGLYYILKYGSRVIAWLTLS